MADSIRIAQESRKAPPVGEIEFRFRTIDDGFPECNREADRRVVDLIVIRIVGYEPPEIVGVQPDLPGEYLGQARFVVVSFRGLDRQPQKIRWADGFDCD